MSTNKEMKMVFIGQLIWERYYIQIVLIYLSYEVRKPLVTDKCILE